MHTLGSRALHIYLPLQTIPPPTFLGNNRDATAACELIALNVRVLRIGATPCMKSLELGDTQLVTADGWTRVEGYETGLHRRVYTRCK